MIPFYRSFTIFIGLDGKFRGNTVNFQCLLTLTSEEKPVVEAVQKFFYFYFLPIIFLKKY